MKSQVLNFIVAMFVMIAFLTTESCAQETQTVVVTKSDRSKGWLGVSIEDVTRRLAEKKKLSVDGGAFVADVTEDSPAEEAGLEQGDVIVKIDGKNIGDSDDLTRAVRKTKPGTEVKIEIVRGSEHKTLTAKLDRVPKTQSFSFGMGDGSRAFSIPQSPKIEMHMFRSRAMLGLEVQDLTKQLGEYFEVPGKKGVLVTEVKKGSDAERAGFKAGDVIIDLNKSTIRDVDEFYEEVETADEEKESEFGIIRKGKSTSIKMKIDKEDKDEDDLSYRYFRPDDDIDASMNFPVVPKIHHNRLEELKGLMKRLESEIEQKVLQIKEKVEFHIKHITAGLLGSKISSCSS